jgi:hypothetical protein
MSLMHPGRASLGRTAGDRAVFACSGLLMGVLTAAAESHAASRAEHAFHVGWLPAVARSPTDLVGVL